MEKKNLGSAAKNRDGRMIVNKHTFFSPYTFWFASFISFGLVRPRKKYNCDLCLRFPAENN